MDFRLDTIQNIKEALNLDNQLFNVVFNKQLQIFAKSLEQAEKDRKRLGICTCNNKETHEHKKAVELLRQLCLKVINEAEAIGELIFFYGKIPLWTEMQELVFKRGVELYITNVESKEVFKSNYTGGVTEISQEVVLREWIEFCINYIILDMAKHHPGEEEIYDRGFDEEELVEGYNYFSDLEKEHYRKEELGE